MTQTNKYVFVVDLGNTFINSVDFVASKCRIHPHLIQNSRHEIPGIPSEKIYDLFSSTTDGVYSQNNVLHNIVPEVYDLIKNDPTVFVSTGWGSSNVQLKKDFVRRIRNTDIVNENRTPIRPVSHTLADLQVFKETASDEYKNLLLRLQNEGYMVIVIDDSPKRIEDAISLEIDYVLVNRPWNQDYLHSAILVINPNYPLYRDMIFTDLLVGNHPIF